MAERADARAAAGHARAEAALCAPVALKDAVQAGLRHASRRAVVSVAHLCWAAAMQRVMGVEASGRQQPPPRVAGGGGSLGPWSSREATQALLVACPMPPPHLGAPARQGRKPQPKLEARY